MAVRKNPQRCETCGAGGTLVQFGDAHDFHYHCLTCWKQVAEEVALTYAERRAR